MTEIILRLTRKEATALRYAAALSGVSAMVKEDRQAWERAMAKLRAALDDEEVKQA